MASVESLRRECDTMKRTEKMLCRQLSLAQLEAEKCKGMARAALSRAAKARYRFEEEAIRAKRLEDDMAEELTAAHTALRRAEANGRVELSSDISASERLGLANDLAKAERAVSVALIAEAGRDKERLRRLDWVRREDAESYETNVKQLEKGLETALKRVVDLEVSNARLESRAEDAERALVEKDRTLSAQVNALKALIQNDLIMATAAARQQESRSVEKDVLVHPLGRPDERLDTKTKVEEIPDNSSLPASSSWSAIASFLACIDTSNSFS